MNLIIDNDNDDNIKNKNNRDINYNDNDEYILIDEIEAFLENVPIHDEERNKENDENYTSYNNYDKFLSKNEFTDQYSDVEMPEIIKPSNVLPCSKNLLLITYESDKQSYSIPPKTSQDGRKIWKQARIPKRSTLHEIEICLLDWAIQYARLEIKQNTILKISWKISGKSTCTSTWLHFIRWMLSASLSHLSQ